MNDSADMAARSGFGSSEGDPVELAAARLGSALDRIESRIGTLAGTGSQVTAERDDLRRKLAQAESFVADRADLAARLDRATAESRAKDDTLAARQREFDTLARRTEDEIAAIAKQVEAALNADSISANGGA